MKYGKLRKWQRSHRAARRPAGFDGRPFLEVADRGPGIAAQQREKIFEPFFTGNERGTGLGLFLARELAQTNGATLLYEPRTSGGSLFRLVFRDPERWVAELPRHQRMAPPLILVVDDEPDLVELVTLTLSRMQLATQSAGDVAGAKKLLKASISICASPTCGCPMAMASTCSSG